MKQRNPIELNPTLTAILALIAGLALSAGCKPQEPFTESRASDATEDIKESVNDAVEARQDAAKTKDEAVIAAQNALDEMDVQIEELAGKAANLSGEAGAKANSGLDELRKLRDATAQELENLKTAGGDTWRDAASGLDKAWQQLEDPYEQVEKEFTDYAARSCNSGLLLKCEAHFEGDLPVLDAAIPNIATNLRDFEPAQIVQGLGRPLDGVVDRFLGGFLRCAGEMNDFIDVVFHGEV